MQPTLSDDVNRALKDFVEAAEEHLGGALSSVVLFGSAADGTLRSTSDVNLILILDRFEPSRIDLMMEPARRAHALVELSAMYLLAVEIPSAVRAFADKFADILRRRRILFGSDPFTGLTIPRSVELARLSQVLLNSTLRMRSAYVMRGLQEEQLAIAIAEAAGPLRADAATLLELEGRAATTPKQALIELARSTAADDEQDWDRILARISDARERVLLPPGAAKETLLRLIALSERMQRRAADLLASEGGAA